MDPKARLLAETRLFSRLAFLSVFGFAFYYAHFFFGFFESMFVLKTLSIMFLLATIPLPVIAVNNRKLFPAIQGTGKTALRLATMLLLLHHFVLTFVFVMFVKAQGGI